MAEPLGFELLWAPLPSPPPPRHPFAPSFGGPPALGGPLGFNLVSLMENAALRERLGFSLQHSQWGSTAAEFRNRDSEMALSRVRSGQVRSECLTCTLTASCCNARLFRAQVPTGLRRFLCPGQGKKRGRDMAGGGWGGR